MSFSEKRKKKMTIKKTSGNFLIVKLKAIKINY